MITASHIPALFVSAAGLYRHTLALSYRQNDAWATLSSSDVSSCVYRWAYALHRLGVAPQECVGLMAASSPFWLMADVAIHCARGVVVPLFDNISKDNLQFQCRQTALRRVIVDRPEHARCIEALGLDIQILLIEKVSLSLVLQDKNITDDIPAEESKDWAYAHMAALSLEDTASIIYTSGSTGVPKGVELTHGHFIRQVEGTQQRFTLEPGDVVLSCLPLAHIFERMVMYFYISCGLHIYFVDDVQKLGAYMADVKPVGMTMVPRILEKIKIAIDQKKEKHRFWQTALGKKLIENRLCKHLGGRFRYIIVGGAALSKPVAEFFLQAGVPVYQGYGLTETSPVLAVNYPGFNRPGTVGPLFPKVEIKMADDGEICVRSAHVMKGYYHNPEATKEVIDSEGWFHTGDLGSYDSDGYVVISGRKKELCKLSTGKYVSPGIIEQKLQAYAAIDYAVVVADGRPFVTALLFLKSFAFQSQIDAILEEVNASLNEWEKIKKYVCLGDQPTVANGILTPTMKIRRGRISELYHTHIEKMYR